LVFGDRGSEVSFIHVDHLNTPRLISDSTGTAVWKWDQQEPFGNTPPDDNPSGLGAFEFPLRLSSYYHDKETGMQYAMLRDCYHPATGLRGTACIARQSGKKNRRLHELVKFTGGSARPGRDPGAANGPLAGARFAAGTQPTSTRIKSPA